MADNGTLHEADHLRLQKLIEGIEASFLGKRRAVELTLTALLAQGHVLFEDVPGVGKTTLSRVVAHALGCRFKRIQFTSDLLPADIVGVNTFDPNAQRFEFRPGPIFAHVVLADEINRTTPRTQSALLEAMNEAQVTIDNETHALPGPFMVLATQNPLEFAGTYPLPESQLDRFLMRVSIGYPAPEVERKIIVAHGVQTLTETESLLTVDELVAMQQRVRRVRAEDAVLDYLQGLVERTRDSAYLALGVSPRGAIALHHAAQAHAYLSGRDYVLPDDIKQLFVPVCAHRITLPQGRTGANGRTEAEAILAELLEQTPVPV